MVLTFGFRCKGNGGNFRKWISMTSTFIEVKLGLDKLLKENEFKLSLVVVRSISLNLNNFDSSSLVAGK